MQKHIYDLRFEADKIEWRIRAKRDLVFRFWNKYRNTQMENYSMLDFGCGLGVLQKEFEENYPKAETFGVDVETKAIEYARKLGLKNSREYDGVDLPYKDNKFDIVTAIDVLEHVKDDMHALDELKRVLKKDGIGFFLVPAHMHLWSTRDIRLCHFRRYENGELESKVAKKGFKILENKNVDFGIYFMLLAMAKTAKKVDGVADLTMDTAVTNPVVNEIMFWYEMVENYIQTFTTFPIGISKVVVVQK